MTTALRRSVRSTRRHLRTARSSVASGVQLASRRRPRLGYVGFVGARNVGDDAILLAERQAFPRARVIPVPDPRHADAVFGVAGALTGGRPLDGVLLGGGTLVGRFEWWERVAGVLDRYPAVPAIALGVGAEDPSFEGAGVLTSADELARWGDLLARFERVTTRGPRSQAVLATAGVDAAVVGDPALLLRAPADALPRERRLGLNVAVPEVIWGGDHAAVVDAVTGAATRLLARGWEIDLFAFRPTDAGVTSDVARALCSDRVRIIDGWRDLEALLDALARCAILVGERLHSVVLAAACGVPAVMLEYRPKCADFVESLGRDAGIVSLRTDALSAPLLVDAVDILVDDGDGSRARLGVAVDRLRTSLLAEVDRLHAISPLSGA